MIHYEIDTSLEARKKQWLKWYYAQGFENPTTKFNKKEGVRVK